MRVAVLNDKGVLVGAKMVAKPKANDVDCGDLPADGRYKWHADRGAFLPLGFGNGKPKRPPVDRDRAVFLLIRAVVDGRPVPQECRDWCDWYERHNG